MEGRYVIVRFFDNDFSTSALKALDCINYIIGVDGSDESIQDEFKRLMYHFSEMGIRRNKRVKVPAEYFDKCIVVRQNYKPYEWENSEVVCLDVKENFVWLL